MTVRSAMYNLEDGKFSRRDYLSAGKTVLPRVYFLFSIIYFVLATVWLRGDVPGNSIAKSAARRSLKLPICLIRLLFPGNLAFSPLFELLLRFLLLLNYLIFERRVKRSFNSHHLLHPQGTQTSHHRSNLG